MAESQDFEIGNADCKEILTDIEVKRLFDGKPSDDEMQIAKDIAKDEYKKSGNYGAGYNGKWSVRVDRTADLSIFDAICDRQGISQQEMRNKMLCFGPYESKVFKQRDKLNGNYKQAAKAFVDSFNGNIVQALALSYLEDQSERQTATDNEMFFREVCKSVNKRDRRLKI
jgi:hypothetical protein